MFIHVYFLMQVHICYLLLWKLQVFDENLIRNSLCMHVIWFSVNPISFLKMLRSSKDCLIYNKLTKKKKKSRVLYGLWKIKWFGFPDWYKSRFLVNKLIIDAYSRTQANLLTLLCVRRNVRLAWFDKSGNALQNYNYWSFRVPFEVRHHSFKGSKVIR